MRLGTLALIGALALAGCTQVGVNTAGAPGTDGVTPAQIRTLISRDGATATVQSLDKDSGAVTFDKVLSGIASGREEWLGLVPLLAPGVDGGTSTGLQMAVTDALLRNPAGVLRLAASGWPVADSCSYPMSTMTEEGAQEFFAAAVPALNAVTDPSLQAIKQSCLTEMRTGRDMGGRG